MTSTFLISVLLGIFLRPFHSFNEFFKKICAVLGSRCAFGVILDAENLVLFTFHAFDRFVEQVYVVASRDLSSTA